MIAKDQPTCFPADIVVGVSSTSDGTVLDRAVGVHNPTIVTNRTRFCDTQGISYGDVVYQRITYSDKRTYDVIAVVDETDTCKYVDEVAADALITTQPGVGMLLPVADCVATVLYDSATKQLALAHLGRHSTLANLMQKTIATMVANGAQAQDIVIWMAPSVSSDDYRMEYFDYLDDAQWQHFANQRDDGVYLDLQGYNQAQAIAAGVWASNVHRSPVNTARDDNYFSHSQGDITGRFAVLAYRPTRT